MMQDASEFAWLLQRLAGVTSLLEIGNYDGGALRGFVAGCPNLKRLRAIDIAPQAGLATYIAELKAGGFDAEMLVQNSAAPEAIEWAAENGPYDFIFIDGDHDAGVFVDWRNYRDMAPLLGFHDIVHTGHQVQTLWQQIKQEGHRTEECATSYQGVGVVWPNAA